MVHRTSVAFAFFVLALAGCSDKQVFFPTPTESPKPRPVPAASDYTLSDVTLSGVVFEETLNARAPIEGVAVYCEPCTELTHVWAYTDAHGFYSFRGVWTDPGHFPTRLLIRKDGYTDPAGIPTPTPPNPSLPGWREVVIDGDTRFDVRLVRR